MPLGSAVVPDVYVRVTGSSSRALCSIPSISAACPAAQAAPVARTSVQETAGIRTAAGRVSSRERMAHRSGRSPARDAIFSACIVEVMAKRDAECFMRKRISPFSLIFTEIGTLMPPARRMPSSAAIQEFLPSASRETLSCGARPRDRRKPATSRASPAMARKVASRQPCGVRSRM